VIRSGIKILVLARGTPDLIYEQMVAAGCAPKVVFSYMGNPGMSSLRILREEMENEHLEWKEFSHFGMISRLQAGTTGLPFMPMNPTVTKGLEEVNPLKNILETYTQAGMSLWNHLGLVEIKSYNRFVEEDNYPPNETAVNQHANYYCII
jgi:glutaconate CoA-transferase subunit A